LRDKYVGKISLVQVMMTYRGGRGLAPPFLNLGTRWMSGWPYGTQKFPTLWTP